MEHSRQIKRWADCPDGTKVWIKNNTEGWTLLETPMWLPDEVYVVDDEYSDLRKAYLEGKEIEVYQGDWYDIGLCNAKAQNFELFPPDSYYRIKSDDPVYYWQWEKLDKDTGGIMITEHYTDKKANYHGYQVNSGWRKIENSKRIWDEQ